MLAAAGPWAPTKTVLGSLSEGVGRFERPSRRSRNSNIGSVLGALTLPLLLSLVVIGWLAASSGPVAAQSQHGAVACMTCHLLGDGPDRSHDGALMASEERLCSGCHRGAFEASHPTGFVPERPLPAQFPLDSNGQMTCSTCHDLHRDGRIGLRAASNGPELCLACHQAGFFEAMADRGSSLLASGHLSAGAGQHAATQVSLQMPIDPYSARCVECHPDSLSVEDDGIRGQFSASNGTGWVNHPIGSHYDSVAMTGRYRPSQALPREISLPNGQVACISCHQGYSGEHGKRVAVRGLCTTCHDL